jgi:hypothetical protein
MSDAVPTSSTTEPSQQASRGVSPPASGNAAANTITPELIHAIADRVYARLLLDLKYENERRPSLAKAEKRGVGITRLGKG